MDLFLDTLKFFIYKKCFTKINDYIFRNRKRASLLCYYVCVFRDIFISSKFSPNSALFFQRTGDLENIDPRRNVRSFSLSPRARLLFTILSLWNLHIFPPSLCVRREHASTSREQRTRCSWLLIMWTIQTRARTRTATTAREKWEDAAGGARGGCTSRIIAGRR